LPKYCPIVGEASGQRDGEKEWEEARSSERRDRTFEERVSIEEERKKRKKERVTH